MMAAGYGEGDAEIDGDAIHRDGGGAAATVECGSSGTTSAAAEQPAAPIRRSSRQTFRGEYAPASRASAKRIKTSAGRGMRMLLRDEVRNPLLGLRRKKEKRLRVDRLAKVQRKGKAWTREKLLARRRTRQNCSQRKMELIAIFEKALDKIQKAGTNISTLVENADRMLTPDRVARVCRVISTVQAYLVLEIRGGVHKLEHSRAAGEGAGVDARTVRTWVTEFCKDGKFVVPDRAYVKRQPHTFIDDEDIADKCREYMGDAVVLARGKGKTEEEKQAAEAKALAAAQETRTKSMKRTAAVFKAWKKKVASRKEALQRVVLRRAMNAWKQNSL
ncbi:unnamed protein product [Ectocarpus sp. 12 AP-2014]